MRVDAAATEKDAAVLLRAPDGDAAKALVEEVAVGWLFGRPVSERVSVAVGEVNGQWWVLIRGPQTEMMLVGGGPQPLRWLPRHWDDEAVWTWLAAPAAVSGLLAQDLVATVLLRSPAAFAAGPPRHPGLTLTFDTRLHRFDPTAIDALIAQVLGPDTDVTIEERSNLDAEGPAFIRINGSNPHHLAAVADAFYDRVWRSAEAVVEERAVARAMSSGVGLLLARLDEIRGALSGMSINHPAVQAMLTDQAATHALTKAAAASRIEEINARLQHERSARQALRDLIAGLFAPGSLHAWTSAQYGPTVAHALPGPTASHAEAVESLVAALERRGLVDARLFELLAEGGPQVAGAVNHVAALCGLAGAVAE